MSKSLDYAVATDSARHNKDMSVEKLASYYMDWVLQGQREKVKDSIYGVVKTVIEFDPDAEFNYLNSWSGTIEGELNDEALEEQLVYISWEELNDRMRVPCDKNHLPLGGMPENGDTFHITFGNYIISILEQREDSSDVCVALPMKYELIKGKKNV